MFFYNNHSPTISEPSVFIIWEQGIQIHYKVYVIKNKMKSLSALFATATRGGQWAPEPTQTAPRVKEIEMCDANVKIMVERGQGPAMTALEPRHRSMRNRRGKWSDLDFVLHCPLSFPQDSGFKVCYLHGKHINTFAKRQSQKRYKLIVNWVIITKKLKL